MCLSCIGARAIPLCGAREEISNHFTCIFRLPLTVVLLSYVFNWLLRRSLTVGVVTSQINLWEPRKLDHHDE